MALIRRLIHRTRLWAWGVWIAAGTALALGILTPVGAWLHPAPHPDPNLYMENPPTLADYFAGHADWVLDIPDTGLPEGESDTVYLGDGIYRSYLHASYESAGVRDSCGAKVPFPGCVTVWESTDGGRAFSLTEQTCMLACRQCPCDDYDRVFQQQYPRVHQMPDGAYYMAFETGASTLLARSADGLNWTFPELVPYTGAWTPAPGTFCPDYNAVGPHLWIEMPYTCMAGGPPGIYTEGPWVYVFVGAGQNPGNMACYRAPRGTWFFQPCPANPILTGSPEYGPVDLGGESANAYWDYRYITSADIIRQDGMYYMAYEGIRGPGSPDVVRDDQFALGFARSAALNGQWEEYPGNPALGIADNWGYGHADLLVVNGITVMYTATDDLTRGRYILQWLDP